MTEKLSKIPNSSCHQIAHSEDAHGNITSVELRIFLGGKSYLLNVATSEYVSGLREYNSQFPEEEQLEDRFYIVDGETLPSKDELCNTITQIPFENLQPLLREIPKEPPPSI